MKVTNAMQLKALVKNKAKSINVSAQLVMQNYVLERLLERIVLSRFKDNFIVKGGFLLAAVIGLDTRTTKDLDTTVRNLKLAEKALRDAFSQIIGIESDDDLSFEIGEIEEIREGHDYPGMRVHLVARFEQLTVPLAVDVTAGDSIVPPPSMREFPRMFDDGTFLALSYPFETVAAEKIETVLSRSTANTRARDYYDIYVLDIILGESLDFGLLHEALLSTTAKRNTNHIIIGFNDVVDTIANDVSLNQLWEAYVKKNDFAEDITFKETCESILHLLEKAGFKG